MPEFKVKRLLTRPVLKLVQDQPIYVKIEAPMHVGKEVKADMNPDGTRKKEPATLVDVIDLTTGAQAQVVVSAVVKSVWDDDYPERSYVGKCFAITKKGRQPGKQYFGYDIAEIEDPTPAPVADSAEQPVADNKSTRVPGKNRAA